MKKIFLILLCVLMLCIASSAMADYNPGDTVTITVSINSNSSGVASGMITVNALDDSVLVFQSANKTMAGMGYAPQKDGAAFTVMSSDLASPVPTGTVGTVTYKISSSAPAGKYTISVSSGEFGVSGGTTITVVIPPCATHTWDDGHVHTAVTCTSDGQKYYLCKVCGAQSEMETIKSNGHTAGTPYVKTAATCTADGTRVTPCATCDAVMKEEPIPATGHTAGDVVVTKKPTCTEPGTQVTKCATCGATMETKTLDPLGHTPVTDAAVAPTCTKTGLTEGSHCSVCNAVIKAQETVAVIAHDTNKVETEGASCTAPGKKLYYCSMCGALQKTEEVAVLGHTPAVDAAVPATCTETGLTEGSHCSVCNEVIKAQETVAALGHTVVTDPAVAPTCTEAGKTEGSHCSVCNTVLVKQESVPAAHTPGSEAVRVEPTCTTDGSTSFVCTVCGVKIDSQKIPALGHKWDEGKVTTEPTCTKKGEKTFTCLNDATHTRTESIKATGEHIWDEGKVTTEPTCTKNGTKTYTCTYEGCTKTKKETLTKLGHKYDEGVVTTAATCTKNGVKTYTCLNDAKHTKTETITKLGHKYDEGVVTTAPTCTENGVKTYTCLNDAAHTKTERINKLGHAWGEWVVTKPVTEEENGEQQRTCATCAYVETQVIRNRADYHMTVCSKGIRFRDLDNPLTESWYMFTPIDLSVDGVQTFDLIAGNFHWIGTVSVEVKEGNVTVTYDLVNNYEIHNYGEFLTILPSLADVTEVDIDEMTNYAYGEPISIEEDLGGDTKVLLFMCNNVLYPEDAAGIEFFKKDSDEYKAYVEELKLLMD